jgi:type I restriction enzyme S subunit
LKLGILSAYDDLIDNNNRRIALLEEAIHRLYREWFVHLRFPGYEHTLLVAGVPQGWEKRPVKDAFEIMGGGTPRRKEERYWADGTINWFTPSDLTKTRSMFRDSSSEKISEAGFSNSSARMFPAYSVMMTSRATIGVIAINTFEATTNQGFITCIPNERVPVYFLYCWLTANANVFESFATGSTFKEISKGVFKKIPVLLPTQALLKDFHEFVEPMAKQVLNLQRQIQYLEQARDALLPRLMNGSLAV